MDAPDSPTINNELRADVAPGVNLQPGQRLDLSDLRSVKLRVEADLGSARIRIRDVIDMKVGTVVPLNKLAGELTDLYVNGLPLGKGEVVVVGDNLHVRVAEIEGAEERPENHS